MPLYYVANENPTGFQPEFCQNLIESEDLVHSTAQLLLLRRACDWGSVTATPRRVHRVTIAVQMCGLVQHDHLIQ